MRANSLRSLHALTRKKISAPSASRVRPSSQVFESVRWRAVLGRKTAGFKRHVQKNERIAYPDSSGLTCPPGIGRKLGVDFRPVRLRGVSIATLDGVLFEKYIIKTMACKGQWDGDGWHAACN